MSPAELAERSKQILRELDRLDPVHSEAQRTIATRACLALYAGRKADAGSYLSALADQAASATERTAWLQLGAQLDGKAPSPA